MSKIKINNFIIENNIKYIIGVDEVGRGSLMGPVYTCCVYLEINKNSIADLNNMPYTITDSKKLKKITRKSIINYIKNKPYFKFTIAEASKYEIDDLNIRNANNLAMNRAIHKMLLLLKCKNTYISTIPTNTNPKIFIDGNYYKPILINEYTKENITQSEYNYDYETIIKGDIHNISIALASIFAKEYRDDYITKMHNNYPYYKWDTNFGYGTKEHFKLIGKNGIHWSHRLSFLKKYLNN